MMSDSASVDDYRRFHESQLARSCHVPVIYFKMFSNKSEALCLAAIVQLAQMDLKHNPAHDANSGWFLLPSRRLQGLLQIGASQENRLVASLRNKGLITTEMRGSQPQRWCRLNPEAITNAMEAEVSL